MEIELGERGTEMSPLQGREGGDTASAGGKETCHCRSGAKILVSNRRWNQERIARLAFLVGRGMTALQISQDPIVGPVDPNSLTRQANRLGLLFRDALAPRLPTDVETVLDVAALKRQLTRDALMKNLMIVVAREPTLIDNILDDGR